MSSRPWVRIPPALPGDVAQTSRALACQARGRRFESGRPRSWWLWCNGSTRGCEPRGTGSNPVGHPSTLGMWLWWQSASLATRRSGFDSRRLHHCLRSVNGKHAPFVRPRCGFDSCRRLLRGRSSAGRARDCHSREARSIRVVRFVGLWCNRQHGELQPRRSGFESWRACCTIVAGRSGSVISWAREAVRPAVRLRAPTALHDRDVSRSSSTTSRLRAGSGTVIG
jgi:hypothetical protein